MRRKTSRDADDLGRRQGVTGQLLSDPHETESKDEKRGSSGGGWSAAPSDGKKEVTERGER